MTLNEIFEKGVAIVYMGGEAVDNKPSGMVISCSKKLYHVYFQVNDENDFEYVNSYSVKEYAKSSNPNKPPDFEDILEGGNKLAIGIENGEVDL
jgi:hypothetical protein